MSLNFARVENHGPAMQFGLAQKVTRGGLPATATTPAATAATAAGTTAATTTARTHARGTAVAVGACARSVVTLRTSAKGFPVSSGAAAPREIAVTDAVSASRTVPLPSTPITGGASSRAVPAFAVAYRAAAVAVGY